MKICFYCDSIFTFGGVQRVLSEVAKGLAMKHEVTILTCDDPSLAEHNFYGLKESGIRILFIHYPRSPFYEYYPCKVYSLLYKKVLPQNNFTTNWYASSSFSWSYQKKLIKKLNQDNYDVIVGVHVFPSLHLSAIKKRLKKRVIGWLHNSYSAFFEHPGQWLWKGEQRFRCQMNLLDKVLVLTAHDQMIYQKQMNLNTDVIYNPLTVTIEQKGSPLHRKFVSVGRLVPYHKGFDILIKAFAIFAQKETEWTLDLIGEGPEEQYLRSLIKENNLEGRVLLHPFTNHIQTYYSAGSVYILSSRWEGFGLVWLEAMAHGLPIIASDIPVVKELLGNASNTLIFRNEDINDLAQKMLEIVHRENLEQMSEASCEVVQKFSLSEILKQWELLLEV